MKWIFTHCKSMEADVGMKSHAVGQWTILAKIKINSDCSSMVVFFNMLFLKYYHAHNIHHY